VDDANALRMNLLTVVLHELGLALGFVEDDPMQPAIMARTLVPGMDTPPALLPLIGSGRVGVIRSLLHPARPHRALGLAPGALHRAQGKVTHRGKGKVKA
jgi:hypothetical protein